MKVGLDNRAHSQVLEVLEFVCSCKQPGMAAAVQAKRPASHLNPALTKLTVIVSDALLTNGEARRWIVEYALSQG